jgi:hypothetical protein
MSALPPKADIAACDRHVRLVPKADIGRKARPFDLLHVMMLRQSFDYRKWIGLDIGVVTHHVRACRAALQSPGLSKAYRPSTAAPLRAEDFWRYV